MQMQDKQPQPRPPIRFAGAPDYIELYTAELVRMKAQGKSDPGADRRPRHRFCGNANASIPGINSCQENPLWLPYRRHSPAPSLSRRSLDEGGYPLKMNYFSPNKPNPEQVPRCFQWNGGKEWIIFGG
jgi:hypothetical protein